MNTHDHDHDHEEEEEEEDYVNEHCPSQCSEDHLELDDNDGVQECPATGERWGWCIACSDGWVRVRTHTTRFGRTYTTPEFRCGPSGDQFCEDCWNEMFFHCDDCCEPVNQDDACTTDGGWYCPDCYEAYRDDDEFLDTAQEVVVCQHCRQPNLHLHLLTERFLCDCAAEVGVRRGHPIILAKPFLVLPGIVTDDYGVEHDVRRPVHIEEVAA